MTGMHLAQDHVLLPLSSCNHGARANCLCVNDGTVGLVEPLCNQHVEQAGVITLALNHATHAQNDHTCCVLVPQSSVCQDLICAADKLEAHNRHGNCSVVDGERNATQTLQVSAYRNGLGSSYVYAILPFLSLGTDGMQ